jgi:hypothetical protein
MNEVSTQLCRLLHNVIYTLEVLACGAVAAGWWFEHGKNGVILALLILLMASVLRRLVLLVVLDSERLEAYRERGELNKALHTLQQAQGRDTADHPAPAFEEESAVKQ